ncbi:hypothetical protein SNS2_3938 [Streptomyces netropsis]|uniref:Asp-tRNA(Asn)/Glu-tRNA(Gln) amidotransferase A subunit family amidase n=1 Tax=Streptomyces syringium TaxID=76729 RepID=A0ABS4Y930_9ACTN|nr:hypothetical protein [Streptomyces syringium]MBP2405309.1 Asp-tRNA(Asn)/Glu-tRNA(Gln) amidotransferase A subunit family amidase [Streptomyces syringium]SPE58326.1 hypothetical protein SNS2_3938 [Streptomyces netropsis]
MRVNKLVSTAIAAVACGSLVVGVAGPALAAAPEPAPTAAAPDPKAATAQQLETVANLGELLALAAKIATEAQAKTPNKAVLADLRQRYQAAADKLLKSVKSRAGTPGGLPADAVKDVRDALAKLTKDLTELLAAVVAVDLPKVTAGIAEVVKDLQALLTAVPKLATGALPLPVPGV